MNTKPCIAIIGATGFIGSYLAKIFYNQKYPLVILKRSSSNTKRIDSILKNATVCNMDEENLEKIFKKEKVDIVINLATHYGRSSKSKASDLFSTNLVFPLKLIEVLQESKVSLYLNIDTLLDYKTSIYAYSKFILHNLLKKYLKLKFQVFNIKLSYVCGKNDDETKFLPFAINSLKKNIDIEMTKGEQKIDFIDIKDVVDAIIFLIENKEKYSNSFEEFEVGTGTSFPLREIIEMFKKQLNSKSAILKKKKYRENEQMELIADSSRLLPWKAKHSVKRFILDNYEL